MAAMAAFSGIPADALDFFAELEAHNERAWWHANKDRFEASVAGPMRALLDVLEPEFGTFRVFRMNRDVRFSTDKSPYKTAHAAMTETAGGSSHFVQLSATGLFVGAGIYHPARDQLERFRRAVVDDASGTALETSIADVRAAKVTVEPGREPPLATAPRGFPKDHPRVELLRWKGCIALQDLGAPKWLHTRQAAERVSGVWRRAAPLTAWLDRHVGPSDLPPESRR
jgi:uncharacterized protein (TIGR02453 family)